MWRGSLKATECLTGYGCSAERTIPFFLRVAASSEGYVGSLELGESAREMDVVMDVCGVVQPDGAVLFTGARDPLQVDNYRVELRRLLVQPNLPSGLTGEIDLWKFPNFSGPGRRLEGRITSASYEPPVPVDAVSGSWSGRVVIRECSGYCPGYQNVGDEMAVAVALGQAGDTISGRIQVSAEPCSVGCWVPVTGATNGSHLSLSSELFVPQGEGVKLRLERFDGSIDKLGRLAGSFTFYSEQFINVAVPGVVTRLTCEILWLVRD